MALATIQIFGEYRSCSDNDIPRLCRDTGPPLQGGFRVLGLGSSVHQTGRLIRPPLGLGLSAICVNAGSVPPEPAARQSAANINRLLRRGQGLLAPPEVRQNIGEVVERHGQIGRERRGPRPRQLAANINRLRRTASATFGNLSVKFVP